MRLRFMIVIVVSALASCLTIVSCGGSRARTPDPPSFAVERLGKDFDAATVRKILALSPEDHEPVDPTNRHAADPRAVRLGRRLFHDKRLSKDGTVSCAVCHVPERAFTDGLAVFRGLAEGRRNTPTVWNAAFLRWQFWDGRADTLWSQAQKPIEEPTEMGSTRAATLALFKSDRSLSQAYREIFGELPEDGAAPAAIDRFFADVAKAIAAFEMTIVSFDTKFDRFVAALRKRDAAGLDELDIEARRGLLLFVGRGGCTLCHSGPLLSDREFHNIGLGPRPNLKLDVGRFDGAEKVLDDPMNGLGALSDGRDAAINDRLRFLVQKPNNLGEFKTPALRSVAATAPYMHDGRFATLDAVLEFYSTLDERPAIGHREETLVPLRLDDGERTALKAFLAALTLPQPDPQRFGPP